MSDQLAFDGLSGGDRSPALIRTRLRAAVEVLISELEGTGRLRREDFALAQLALDTADVLGLSIAGARTTGRTYAVPPLVKELRELLVTLRELPAPALAEGVIWESEVSAIERHIAEAAARATAFRDAEAP